MPDTFGFGTDTTNFSNTVRTRILKSVIETLRAGLIALPKGAVVPGDLVAKNGDNFTLRATAYPDLADGAVTDPLSEGVPPTAVKLAISTNDWTVRQVGAYTKVTDLARFQSPHDLERIAADKISRLAAQTIDNLAMNAIRTNGVNRQSGSVLTTPNLVDAVAQMESRNIERVNGFYYGLIHPQALAGLLKETGLDGWTDAAKYANPESITRGEVGSYRGVRFLSSTRIAPIAGADVALANPSAAADDIIDTAAAHGFIAGDKVRFTALTGGAGLSTGVDYYVIAANLAATTFQVSTTPGGTAVNFTTDITAGTVVLFNDVVHFLGAGSIAFGDVRTIEPVIVTGPDSSDPLNQVDSWGFKGILGGRVMSFAEETDGAAVTSAAVNRMYSLGVQRNVR